MFQSYEELQQTKIIFNLRGCSIIYHTTFLGYRGWQAVVICDCYS